MPALEHFAASGGTIDLYQGLLAERGAPLTAKSMEMTLSEIELAQQGLRDSIERARGLTEETARLVLKHRIEMPKPQIPSR